MQVVLRVVGGKHNGREIKISVPKFIIGRGEGTHLRPSSDLVSRNHCCISIEDGQVFVEDMGSRNGTFVNGEQLTEKHKGRSGDTVRVGRLQFELVLDPARASKKAKVTNVVEAAARTASNGKAGLEDSISDWLAVQGTDEGEEAKSETIQFSLEETQSLFDSSSQLEPESGELLQGEEAGTDEKQQGAGKLPPVPKKLARDSKAAADEALKKFFNRR